MKSQSPLRLGLMGFGRTGRQIYDLASRCEDIEIVAIADIGDPKILHYLLCSEVAEPDRYRLENNYLCAYGRRARLLAIDSPAEMPWDVFGVDAVIDATGVYREAAHLQAHLKNGAPRVFSRTLPVDTIDRIIVKGVNDHAALASDQMVSAGSATTSALCLLLKILSAEIAIECASMTSVHAYTSDQALQDYAGSDFRRSRSAAENIIPNTHEAHRWLDWILPSFSDKVLTYVLNVPIHEGCLLDVNLVMEDGSVTVDQINDVMRSAVSEYAGIVNVVEDPIVSSDIIGNASSLLFDTKGTIKAGTNTIKTLSWYENLGHAARLLDVVRIYAALDQAQEVA